MNNHIEGRVNYIDVLKGVGMLLVIFQHCNIPSDCINRMILAFHMPLFFFASGLVNKKRSIGDTLARKCASLLSPVVLYSVINAAMRIVCTALSIEKVYSNLAFGGFWFLLSLLYISIIDYGIEKAIIRRCIRPISQSVLIVVIGVVIIFGGLAFSRIMVGEQVTIATSLVGYGFYSFGKVLGNHSLNPDSIFKRVVFFFAGVGFLTLLVFTSQVNQKVLMYINDYGNSLLFLVNSILGITGIWCISFAIKKNAFFEFFGSNSLVILITHFPVIHTLNLICRKLFGDYNMWYAVMLSFFATCVVEIVIVIVTNRWVPWVAGKIKLSK